MSYIITLNNLRVDIDNKSPLFFGLENKNVCLMSHTYFVNKLPEGFKKSLYHKL